ncbi:MAG TPA: hypothetical protein VK449_04035 [Anaerolineales bacterium]|nr:hypothetical protein [Anaerolineales bacterium]
MLALRVDLVLLSLRESRLRVLLEPAGPILWRLPGADLKEERSLEAAAQDCLRSSVGESDAYLEQLYTYGEPGRVAGRRTVSCVYLGLMRAGANAAAPLTWYDASHPPSLEHDHAAILAYALTRLRYKLEYTAVGFELLPETFTLTELQRTYEIVLSEPLDKRNFRRRILSAGVIEGTRKMRSGDGRPARLYRYRDDAVAQVKARRLFP